MGAEPLPPNRADQKSVACCNSESSADKDADIARHRRMLACAYENHWRELDGLDDVSPYFSYALVSEIQTWALSAMGGEMLSSNFNELINALNAWNHRLRSWAAWNRVLIGISDEHDRWDTRSEFVEPLAHFCLHQPSASKDRLVRFATQAVHVGNMRVDPAYKDELVEDEMVFKRLRQSHPKPHAVFLSREKAQAQLQKLATSWPSAGVLMNMVSQLDTEDYRDRTGDWRNRAAHSIPLHFEFGEVERVTRWVEFRTTFEKGPSGFDFKKDRSKKGVSYAFGGFEPLSLEQTMQANRTQFELAEKAMRACEVLLRELGNRAGLGS